MRDRPADQPALGDWFRLLRRRGRTVVLAGLAAGVLALGGSFLLPKWYRATASILPPHQTEGILASPGLLASTMSAARGRYSGDFSLFDVYVGILLSDTIARSVVEELDLAGHYGTSDAVGTMKRFRRSLGVGFSTEGIISVSVEDRDPEMAAAVANAIVAELDRLFREKMVTTAGRERRFWEGRAAQSAGRIDSLESILSHAQVQGGVTAMGRDASEASLAAGELLSRRMSLGVRLQMLDAWNVESAPLRKSLESELNAVDAEIAKLPDVGLRLAEAIRDLRIAESLHQGIVSQLEQARLDEARDTPMVETLDRAVAPDRHVRPRRPLVALAGVVLGTGLVLTWVAYREGLG